MVTSAFMRVLPTMRGIAGRTMRPHDFTAPAVNPPTM